MQVLEVPEIVVGGLGLRNFNVWFGLRGVDQVREINSVLNEEDWNVVAHDIPITLLCVEFDGKASHVTYRISATSRPKHRGEPEEDRSGSRSVSQNTSTGQLFSAFVELEGSECTGPTGMDYPFGDTFVVGMVYLLRWPVVSRVDLQTITDLISCMTILQPCRTILIFGGDSEPMVRVRHLATPIGSQARIGVMGVFGVLGQIG